MREVLCRQRPCHVIGSAKGVEVPSVSPGMVVIGANGGASIARNAGLRVDVLCTTSYLFRKGRSESEQCTVDSMRGLHVRALYLDVQCGYMPGLDEFDIRADMTNIVPQACRRSVTESACGAPYWVSTGVWAVCLAAVSGARSITVRGVSLTQGHSNIPDKIDTVHRDHVDADAACLRSITADLRLTDALARALS